MSSANVTPNRPTAISWSLPDGSTLHAIVTQTGTTTPAVVGVPTYSGSALGQTAYTGLGGKPAIYGPGTIPTTLGNISIVDPTGNTAPTTTIAGADAETLDTGDGSSTTAYVKWTTAGTPWSQLEIMNSVTSGSTTPICTLSGLDTTAATCVPSSDGNNAAYILRSTVTPAQAVTMASKSGADQGVAFAVDLATLALSKNVTSRINASDEATIAIVRSGVTIAGATTSGSSTGTNQAATGTIFAIPSETYTLTEAATNASTSGMYSSTYACTNAYAASTTVMPNGSGTTFTFAPGPNDQVSCSFTNTALTASDAAAVATKTVAPGASVTDSFMLTNTSAIAATFTGTAPTLTTSTNATLTPTGYTYKGNTYTTYASVLAAVNASATAAGAGVTIGVVYAAPATVGTTISLAVNAAVTANGGTSASQTATETDTVEIMGISVVKTGTTATSPGGLIAYSLLVSNTGFYPANFATLSDPVPAGLTIMGTPTCDSATGGAVCPTIAVAGNTVSARIDTFPANSSLTFSIKTSAGTASSYTNTATLTPIFGPATTGSLTTTVAQSNGISKTVQNLTTGSAVGTSDSALPGDRLEYTLTFVNTTGTVIHAVTLADPLPATVTFSAASCGTLAPAMTCSYTAPAAGGTGTVVFSYVGDVPSGNTLTATIDVLVK
jgi:uncharacterized repeat protein (TIGR01451 family)